MSAERDPGAPLWPLWLAPAVVGLALLVTFGLSAIVAGVMTAAGLDVTGKDEGVTQIAGFLIQDGSFVGAAVYLVARATNGQVRRADFGLRATRPGRAALLALAGFAAFFAFTFVWNLFVGVGAKQEDLFTELGVSRHGFEIAVLAVLVCVVAPIAEEFFFRGFGFGILRPRVGVLVASLVIGLLFGLVHVISTPIKLLPELAFLGFVLCLLRARTNSLLPGMAVHATNNAIAYGVLVGWSWQIPPLIVGALVALGLLLRPVIAADPVPAGP